MNPQHPPPLIGGTLLVGSWSSSSYPSLATAPIPRYDTRTVTSTLVTSLSRLEPENTFLGAEKTIGLIPSLVVNAIPSELPLPEVYHLLEMPIISGQSKTTSAPHAASLSPSASLLEAADLLLFCLLRLWRNAAQTPRSSRRRSLDGRRSSTPAVTPTNASPPPHTSSSSSVALSPARLPRGTSEDGRLRINTRNYSIMSTALFRNTKHFPSGFGS